MVSRRECQTAVTPTLWEHHVSFPPPKFYYEIQSSWKNIISEYPDIHWLDCTINILLDLLYFYPPIHSSIHPLIHLTSDAFESKVQTSAHFPLNTSACRSLPRVQYWFIPARVIQILITYCVIQWLHLCTWSNPLSRYRTLPWHPPSGFLMPFPNQSPLLLPRGNYHSNFFPP